LTEVVEKGLKRFGITISKPILAAICIVFGILVIVIPSLLGILIEGILLLTEYMELRQQQTPSTSPSS